MVQVFVVHRYVSYSYPDNKIEDRFDSVERVFDTEVKAIDYIRKEIVSWHDYSVAHKCPVGSVIDETQWSRPGKRAYFKGRDGDAIVFRNLYYTACDVE